MNYMRQSHTATLLNNGNVLVTGGDALCGTMNTAEIYNPSTGLWTSAPTMNQQRSYHAVSVLLDGKLIVTGGRFSSGCTDTVEMYASQ